MSARELVQFARLDTKTCPEDPSSLNRSLVREYLELENDA